MKLSAIRRYPVKSLSGETLERVVLNPGLGLPFDRRWALALPGSDAAADGQWHPKSQFLVLVRTYGLARLACRFDEASGLFSISGPDGLDVTGNLHAPEGREAVADAVARHLGLAREDAPVLVQAESLGYVDTTKGPLSILNMASHRTLEKELGHTLEPERFRMNFWIEGMGPWEETRWPCKRIKIGNTVLQITEPTGRCKATHVNPATGEADVKVMHALKEHFGHTQMGVYATVDEGGPVRVGDAVTVLP